MPGKTIKQALSDTLEDLSEQDFKKFRHRLLDRSEEPRIRRNKVEGKDQLDVADVMVSHYTDERALRVAVEILEMIGCTREAKDLVEDAGGLPSDTASSAGASAGAAGVQPKAGEKHFVDKHQVQLIQRVSRIGPILDELLDEGVINQETYNKIRALPTSQEQMRELYSGPLQASPVCKDIFYKILQEHDKFLVNDLKGNQ